MDTKERHYFKQQSSVDRQTLIDRQTLLALTCVWKLKADLQEETEPAKGVGEMESRRGWWLMIQG